MLNGAKEVASLFATMKIDDQATAPLNKIKGAFNSLGSNLQTLGSSMSSTGASLGSIFLPLAGGIAIATASMMSFDSSMSNIGAVTGRTSDDLSEMRTEILNLADDSRAGPQAVVDSMYDIVGGVSNAATHMAILEQAIATSEAGQANLGGTTSALIGVMNSYAFSAEQAEYASNVLTRTVGMGVGTMDQFGAAMPGVTGLAASMGIEFEDLASAAAYLTTKGNTASAATTQLGGMMSALLNPNEKMKKALKGLGFESGRAAVAQLGLVGTYRQLQDEFGQDAMGPLVGQVEALNGVTALATDGFETFSDTFVAGIDGATEAARNIQNLDLSAKIDKLKSSFMVLAILSADTLKPALDGIVTAMLPVVDAVKQFITENPELVRNLGMVVIGGAALATGLMALGGIISAVGTGVMALGSLFAFATSPIVLLSAAIAALVVSAQLGYPGGISALLSDAATSAQQLGQIAKTIVVNGLISAATAAQQLGEIVRTVVVNGLTTASTAAWQLGATAGLIVVGGLNNAAAAAWQLGTIAGLIVVGGLKSASDAAKTLLDNLDYEKLGLFVTGIGLMGATLLVAQIPVALAAIAGGASSLGAILGSLALVFSPVNVALLLVAGLTTAAMTNFMGFNDFLGVVRTSILNAGVTIGQLGLILQFGFNSAVNTVNNSIAALTTTLTNAYNALQNLVGGLQSYQTTAGQIGSIGGALGSGQVNFGQLLGIAGSAIGSQFSARAEGGTILAGQDYLVGERGPEMIRSSANSQVIPNNQLGGGSPNITIYANDAEGGRRAADAFVRRMGQLQGAFA